MARPFDDHVSSQYTGSSLSSQTSLAGNRAWMMTAAEGTSLPPPVLSGDVGLPLSKPRSGLAKSPSVNQRSRLGKIKSSPSSGALSTARKNSSHGRLHKRGTSASASPSLISPTFEFQRTSGSGTKDFSISLNAHSNSYSSQAPDTNSMSKSRVMIKPFLRKLSSPEQTSIDLSRSAAENEGLGIYNSSEIAGGPTNVELGYGSIGKRAYHQRTISGNSQNSTVSSSTHRYGAQYEYPVRQTPRPYTPTLGASYQTSLDSEIESVGPVRPSSEGNRFELHNTVSKSYAPLPPPRRLPQPIHTHPGSSSYFASSSQTNLPGTPSSLRHQADYLNIQDVMPITARSSLESVFRRRNRAEIDPVAQAATVAALRQKFNEKEAAKDLKFLQAEAKAREREAKRREKREEEELRKSEYKNRKRTKSNTTNEKSGIATPGEHEHTPYNQDHLLQPDQPRRRRTETAGVAGKAVQSQWSLFWFRFKTMWLRLKRKVSRS